MFCANCGKEQPGEAGFCLACGAPRNGGTVPQDGSPAVVATGIGSQSGSHQNSAPTAAGSETELVARIARAKAGQKGWGWVSAPIENEIDATVVLLEMGKVWYGLAAMHLAVGFFLGSRGNGSAINSFGDFLICVFAGYFLPRRKSRALAVFLLVYAVGSAAMTVANKMHAGSGGGSNVILAVIVVLSAYRGLRATFAYHRSRGGAVRWRNVAIVWASAVLLSVSAVIGVFAANLGAKSSNATTGQLGVIAVIGASGLCFGLLTGTLPFATRSEDEKTAESRLLALVKKTRAKAKGKSGL